MCRPGSVATRWEYRNNPLVDLEKVRAFAMRHTCTHPSLCPIQLCGPAVLDRSHPVGAAELRLLRRARVRRRHRPPGSGGGHLFGGPSRCAAAPRARTRALFAPSRPRLTTHRSSLRARRHLHVRRGGR